MTNLLETKSKLNPQYLAAAIHDFQLHRSFLLNAQYLLRDPQWGTKDERNRYQQRIVDAEKELDDIRSRVPNIDELNAKYEKEVDERKNTP